MTITPTLIGSVFSFAVVFACVYGGVLLWRRRIPGLATGPSARTALYLSRFAVALEYYGLRPAEITSHVDALRGDLGAVDPAAIDATLKRLGPPRTLAAEMTNGVLRPSLLRGLVWSAIGLLIALAASILATEAFLSGFEAVADPGATASWSSIGFDVEATMGTDGRASSIGFGSYWIIVVPAIAFLFGGRLWRLRRRANDRSRSSPA